METLQILFDSDFDGVEVFIPNCAAISLGGKYLASINIWGNEWELESGYLTPEQELEVAREVNLFAKPSDELL